MSDILFARPRHDYAPYRDLWVLAELSGFTVVYIDEIDPESDNVYIYSTPDAESGWPHRWPGSKARIIYWMLEWYSDYKQQPGVNEVWCSNKHFAERINARFVPMGGHAGLAQSKPAQRLYDAAHLFYVTPRRHDVLKGLTDSGLRLAPTAWGVERDDILARSRVMINVHQEELNQGLPPLRVALAAAYQLPLITENGWPITPFESLVLQSPYRFMVDTVKGALAAEHIRYFGAGLHDYLCNHYTFEKSVTWNL